MQLTIPWLGAEDQKKLWQLRLLFPTGVSENQELLETLKTEYSQTGLSEREKKEVAKAIQEAKETPVQPQ
jgi:hypothetical protein